jgi:hypothetical protein
VPFTLEIEGSLTASAIENASLDSLFLALSKREPVSSNAPTHKLLHHLVDTSGGTAYKYYTMVFASTWVGRAVMERRMVAERDEVVKLILELEIWVLYCVAGRTKQ